MCVCSCMWLKENVKRAELGETRETRTQREKRERGFGLARRGVYVSARVCRCNEEKERSKRVWG